MSGERGGPGTSPTREITPCRNKWRSAALLITAVWAVLPSCWNHKLWFGGSLWLEHHWSSLWNAMWLWWLVHLCPLRSRVSDSSGPNNKPSSNFRVIKGTLVMFAANQYWKFCLLTVPCQWKCAFSLIRMFGRSGFSGNIPWKWQNCKRTSLSRSLKECTVCTCMDEDSGY